MQEMEWEMSQPHIPRHSYVYQLGEEVWII